MRLPSFNDKNKKHTEQIIKLLCGLIEYELAKKGELNNRTKNIINNCKNRALIIWLNI